MDRRMKQRLLGFPQPPFVCRSDSISSGNSIATIDNSLFSCARIPSGIHDYGGCQVDAFRYKKGDLDPKLKMFRREVIDLLELIYQLRNYLHEVKDRALTIDQENLRISRRSNLKTFKAMMCERVCEMQKEVETACYSMFERVDFPDSSMTVPGWKINLIASVRPVSWIEDANTIMATKPRICTDTLAYPVEAALSKRDLTPSMTGSNSSCIGFPNPSMVSLPKPPWHNPSRTSDKVRHIGWASASNSFSRHKGPF